MLIIITKNIGAILSVLGKQLGLDYDKPLDETIPFVIDLYKMLEGASAKLK
ncbi:MAG: hypothetical protein LBJ41_02085 [Treponema sp.]|nr:hypothetical protein [Treponema sp.]